MDGSQFYVAARSKTNIAVLGFTYETQLIFQIQTQEETIGTMVVFTLPHASLYHAIKLSTDFKDTSDLDKIRLTACGFWLDRRFRWVAFVSISLNEYSEWLT